MADKGLTIVVDGLYTTEKFPPEKHYLIGAYIEKEAREWRRDGSPFSSIAFDVTIEEEED